MFDQHQHLFLPATDTSAVPLLLLHGTGGNEHDLVPLARQLSPGSAVLSPRGNVLERGAPRFFRRLAEGVFDLADVRHRTHALADFVRAAAEHYGFKTDHLTAIGFSNGANIAGSLLLLEPALLSAAILFRPMVVLDQAAQPGSLAGRRVLLAHGERDPLVPADHRERLAELFRAGGAEVTEHTAQGGGHGLASSDLIAAREFLRSR